MNNSFWKILLLIMLTNNMAAIASDNGPIYYRPLAVKQNPTQTGTSKFPQNAFSDSSGYGSKRLFYIETDPSALFFNGFTLQFRRSTLFRNKMIFGIGYYCADLPDFWIDANPQNQDKGWTARVKNGVDIIADYHLFRANRGLFAGAMVSLYHFEAGRLGMKVRFNSLVPALRLGYMWRPFNNFLYILPVAAIAYNIKASGVNTIAGESLVIKKWAFVPTVNLGVSF